MGMRSYLSCTKQHKLSVRGNFSDRNKIKPENTKMQFESLDEKTRVDIGNLSKAFYVTKYKTTLEKNEFMRIVISKAFREPVQYDYCFQDVDSVYDEYIQHTIIEGDYDEVFTILEFVCPYYEKYYTSFTFQNKINAIFEKEYVGYRFIDGQITQITDLNEIDSINASLSAMDIPATHIKKALTLLSDRKNPDYENSIKESITAVEAICEYISGKNKSTLSEALKFLKDKGIQIHPALENAFIKIYGYTSDSNGIRHAGDLGSPDSTFEEAQYMLVTCSAFVNYLKALSVHNIQSD